MAHQKNLEMLPSEAYFCGFNIQICFIYFHKHAFRLLIHLQL